MYRDESLQPSIDKNSNVRADKQLKSQDANKSWYYATEWGLEKTLQPRQTILKTDTLWTRSWKNFVQPTYMHTQ